MKFTKDKTTNEMETILTAEQASEYTLENIFPTWTPDKDAQQLTTGFLKVSGNTLSWDAVEGAKAYAVFRNGKFVSMTGSCEYAITDGSDDEYTVRVANAMGGFGNSSSTTTGISSAKNQSEAGVVSTSYYTTDGVCVDANRRGVMIMVQKMNDGSCKTTKIVK